MSGGAEQRCEHQTGHLYRLSTVRDNPRLGSHAAVAAAAATRLGLGVMVLGMSYNFSIYIWMLFVWYD